MRLSATAFVIAVTELLLFASPLAAQDRQIVDRPVESFETGLAILSNTWPWWVDNDQLVITALAKGATEEAWGNPVTRAMLVNFATRQSRVIEEKVAILDVAADGSPVLVGPNDRASGGRQISITPKGEVVEIKRFAPGEALPATLADFPHKGVLVEPLWRKEDGYLHTVPNKDYAKLRQLGEPLPTIWDRPGKPSLTLPVNFQEIGPGVLYLRFLGKYLLNPTDPQTSSNTNAAMNSPPRWNRPYVLTPFRLLALDGSVEEIPFPQFIFDYRIGKFAEFRPTRAGIVISQVTSVDGAIYLFESGQLYRLTRKGGLPVVSRSLPMSGVTALTVSPDGCNIAYLHYNVRPIFVKGTTPRYLSIVQVCSGPKQHS
jgi:hypothetical protein